MFTDHFGHRLNKTQNLDASVCALKLERLDVSGRNIAMFDGSAIVTLRADLAGTYADVAFSSAFAYARVWQYLAARWRVVSAHGSMLAN